MLATEPIFTERLALVPLDVGAARDMVHVLADSRLYTFTEGEPPTLAELEDRYRALAAGSPDPDEIWHNWIMRLGAEPIGYVQATVTGDLADLAWVVGTHWQGTGYATEAAAAMLSWLADRGVNRFSAHVHPDHAASAAVAGKIGLQPTGQLDSDGEMRWSARR